MKLNSITQNEVINVFQKCSITRLEQYKCIQFTTELKTYN